MKLTTAKLGKHKIDIEVGHNGKFSAVLDDQDYSADTQAELLEQLKKAIRRLEKQKPIEVTVLGIVKSKHGHYRDYNEGDGFLHALLRGRHDRNRVWLMTTEDGKEKFQIGGYERDGTIVRRLTHAETSAYMALLEQRRKTKTAIEDFIGAVKLDPYKALGKGEE